jgi:hypothetical protein
VEYWATQPADAENHPKSLGGPAKQSRPAQRIASSFGRRSPRNDNLGAGAFIVPTSGGAARGPGPAVCRAVRDILAAGILIA